MQSKSCELDPIPTTLLKEVLHIVLPTITKIANLSLCQGEFCSAWKTATVHPLLKKLWLYLINKNYRPVSNLSFLSKIIERCMLSQSMDHCAECNLLPAYQSAYQPHHSYETSLIKVTNDILWVMEDGKILGFVALDLSAAFDTVDPWLAVTDIAWLALALRTRHFIGMKHTWGHAIIQSPSEWQILGWEGPNF